MPTLVLGNAVYSKEPKKLIVDSGWKCGSAKREVNMTHELYGAAFVWTYCLLLVHGQGRPMYVGSERAYNHDHTTATRRPILRLVGLIVVVVAAAAAAAAAVVVVVVVML